MEKEINKLELAQTKLHNLEAKETNTLAKTTISLQKAILGGLILIFLTVISMGLFQWNVGYTLSKLVGAVPKDTLSGSEMYALLKECNEHKERKIIWFDRKRIHSDAGFAKVDDQFPAQYEIWEGDKLIERWHWQVEHDDRTNQFGDYIFRCVANYDFSGQCVGFTQYQMRDYPTGDASVESERLTVTDSISLKLIYNSGEVILTGPNMSASFVMGKLKNTRKLTNGFPHSQDKLHPIDLVKNEQDFDYLLHLSKTFKFLNAAIIEPYESRTQFVKLIEDAPKKSKAAWDNFVLKMETQPKETKAFIKETWEEKNKDITSN